MKKIPNIYLVSNSPRRKAMFKFFNLPFEVVSLKFDESYKAEMPEDICQEITEKKLRSALFFLGENKAKESVVVVADTLVFLGNKIFGKPTTKDHAHRMLKELSGTTHTVTTGIALGHISESKEIKFVQNHSHTVVEMKSLAAKEIERYVLTEEPMDKAGGYGIQGLGASFVKGIGGCYFNVVGLPIQETCLLLDDLNISYWSNKD